MFHNFDGLEDGWVGDCICHKLTRVRRNLDGSWGCTTYLGQRPSAAVVTSSRQITLARGRMRCDATLVLLLLAAAATIAAAAAFAAAVAHYCDSRLPPMRADVTIVCKSPHIPLLQPRVQSLQMLQQSPQSLQMLQRRLTIVDLYSHTGRQCTSPASAEEVHL